MFPEDQRIKISITTIDFMIIKESINRLFHLVIEWSKFTRDKRYNITCIDNYKICIKFIHNFVQDVSLCMIYEIISFYNFFNEMSLEIIKLKMRLV